MNQKNNNLKLIGWIVGFELVGYFMGLITRANIHPWYEALNKSVLTPPPIVFSVVWSILYAMLALAGWALYYQNKQLPMRSIITLYWAQLIMNWAWTPLFFHFHLIELSLAWLVIIFCLTAVLIFKLWNKKTGLAIMLTPYLLWLLFAAYLNGAIWWLN
ncbi:tryptophan-rich sensory protein [Legionella beliardensis]|uniref:Tryptophan-rich sensory protein n=1 Tax=Legionella beliardensis TaxID=91822 RepID=A0A378IA51_9GAMM|nr:TspO/MBR family protein [Legionella beliardensis]STX29224.1 tryptophan-rich sensory protein [Legionella beliardensis]